MADSGGLDFEAVRERLKSCVNKAKDESDEAELVAAFQSAAGSEQEKKLVVDQVFRDLVKDSVLKGGDMERCELLIKLVIKSALQGYCSLNLVFIVLSDVFDCITLENCDPLFSFVEEKVSTWTMPLFFSAGKNLLLRMCNGLNLMSQFNYENVTTYTKQTTAELKDKAIGSEMEVDGREAGELTTSTVPIDFNLYKKFWALQDYFRNPTQCYTTLAWKTFTQYTKEVLNVFRSVKLEHVTWKKKAKEFKDLQGSDSKDLARYFAKFLTNEKILVQMLIIYQYLAGNVKFKSTNQVLSESQSTWIKDATSQVYELLRETPPDGDKFAKTVEHILEREENWISWKNEGCPSFIKDRSQDEVTPKPTRKRKVSLGEEMASGWKSKKVLMGSNELTRLWNLCPDNLEACKADNRVFLPTLEEYFSEAIEQADPAAMVEEEYKYGCLLKCSFRCVFSVFRSDSHFNF
ncbi:THO complex subunit 1 [Stylophora pistillata]|uniref:THO complex subunit 1 n=1 Tax=Stylophora pistillata TaxID=50429 RepID=A0A2B4RLP6_STYPI|nr:THO complex subunit 1 [Stylophora pistillata]